MTSEERNKLVGILLLVFGGIQTFLIFGFAILFAILASDAPASDSGFLLLLGVFYFIYFLIFVVPQLIGAWKVYKKDSNARNWGIIASFLACFSFPLGTGIGIYALIFLLGDEGKEFYSRIENQNNQTNPSFNNLNQLPDVKLNNISEFDNSKNREPYSWMDKK